jgi:hypothetical protein
MTTSSLTASPGTTCPSWCVTPDCGGDHYAASGSAKWPAVKATAYPKGGDHAIVAFPTWGQCDGLEPAVALYLDGDLEVTIDLTPDEAKTLIARLSAALEAVKAG